MKEIKFRAWDNDRKVMMPNYGVVGQIDAECNAEGQQDESTNFELMQYVGLKDKNGKEMYEKDIIKIEMYDNEYKLFVIEWNDDYCGYVLYYDSDEYEEFNNWLDTSTFEIVDNTFENYELLHDKK